MKRSGLKRKTGLARGDSQLARTPLRRALERMQQQAWPGHSPPPKRKRPVVPKDVREYVLRRTHGLCVVCRAARATQLHHVLPVQTWPQHAKRAANLVGVCEPCHASHEFGGVNRRRIPRACLPASVVAFAAANGAGWYVDKTYPRHDWRTGYRWPTP